MIKLVASDLDGTLLLNGAQSLPEELFPLIKELKELGILFVAASGRQYANMKRMFAPVVDDMAFIAENGGLAIQNEKVLYQDSFPKELVREIVEAIYDKKDADFTCSTKDFYYIRPKTEHYRDLMLNVVKNNCKEIDSFDEIPLRGCRATPTAPSPGWRKRWSRSWICRTRSTTTSMNWWI